MLFQNTHSWCCQREYCSNTKEKSYYRELSTGVSFMAIK